MLGKILKDEIPAPNTGARQWLAPDPTPAHYPAVLSPEENSLIPPIKKRVGNKRRKKSGKLLLKCLRCINDLAGQKEHLPLADVWRAGEDGCNALVTTPRTVRLVQPSGPGR